VFEPVAFSFAGDAQVGDQPQHISVLLKDEAQISGAKLSGRLGQCVEYDVQVKGRAADDLEHVGGRGLLGQRFAQLGEQPRIFDSDDGLIGEVQN
jgi:hypothetical protein